MRHQREQACPSANNPAVREKGHYQRSWRVTHVAAELSSLPSFADRSAIEVALAMPLFRSHWNACAMSPSTPSAWIGFQPPYVAFQGHPDKRSGGDERGMSGERRGYTLWRKAHPGNHGSQPRMGGGGAKGGIGRSVGLCRVRVCRDSENAPALTLTSPWARKDGALESAVSFATGVAIQQ